MNRFSVDPREAGSFFRRHPELILPEGVHPGERKMNWAEPDGNGIDKRAGCFLSGWESGIPMLFDR